MRAPDPRSNQPDHGITHRLIPGGAHTYSKGDDQFPANAPRYIERGEGARVWDDTGRQFIDWTSGLRTMTLGYGVGPVNDAAIEQIRKGSNFGRPSRIETETAQDIVDLIPGAEMVKFAKNGSTVVTAAVKLARAYTGRTQVAFCKDHPFFSYDDWFIGTTPTDGGIPSDVAALSLAFRYNDLASLEALFARSRDIACVVMEAATVDTPVPGFLAGVQALCRKHGAVFILDEMITGFRWHLQGAARFYDLQPDLLTFGKGIGNGFSVSALVGRRDIMDLGGIWHDKKRVFLISTTHGAENHALAATRAALKIYREKPVVEHIWRIGQELMDGFSAAARRAGVEAFFQTAGYPCNPAYICRDATGAASLPLRTLFMQEMIRQGIFLSYISPGFAHGAAEVQTTVEAAEQSLRVYRRALDEGWEKFLDGPPIKPVFRPYN